ncbi:hypothetical protein B0T10DRAFT_306564 [Thelonectria olida]|uniref:Uncharacterized protein n=1 Tax=Thelonectria olida TaxID=1576542 RepID=A0A9P9AR01_9HYPO|nr:hypothetical protein B0T10DRAFT_306564 [Thelonectria olida]
MSQTPSLPGSPGGPLQAVTPERVNQQRESIFSHLSRGSSRDSSVHDKISQFNNLSVSMQSKQLERKTADAALKRAMLGREEAETEMRRYKEEVKGLRKSIEEGKERERRVGERLETLMENYGRAKETHAHTQALWEKEIRRARKETFKTQSTIVKIQEELKSARNTAKMNDENFQREKERSKAREQEAFTARYQIVGVQEQLDQALERIKVVEQERDAFKTAAANEEVARIAAEGRIPLPTPEGADDEFASPKKKKQPRVSLSTMDILSSAASEAEIEDLTVSLQFERQRANRAQEMVEFLQAECQLRCCPCAKSKPLTRPKRRSSIGLESPHDKVLKLSRSDFQDRTATPPRIEEPKPHPGEEADQDATPKPMPRPKKGPRLSTIFCPKEGIFRTVSEQEAEALEAQNRAEANPVRASVERETIEETRPESRAETVVESDVDERERNPRMYARTPSVEPPSFALLAQERASLASLLDAPHTDDERDLTPLPSIPTMPDVPPAPRVEPAPAQPEVETGAEAVPEDDRPHTSAAFYTVTTTTSVPLHDGAVRPSSSFSERLRTPSRDKATFDLTNPALTPTMTREQALAKIRERRGRARSMAQGTMTPRRKMVEGAERRNMSAPTGAAASAAAAKKKR